MFAEDLNWKKSHQRVYFNAEDGMVMTKVIFKISHNLQPQFGGLVSIPLQKHNVVVWITTHTQ